MAWTRATNTDADWSSSDPQSDIFDGLIFDPSIFDATVELWASLDASDSRWSAPASDESDIFDATIFDMDVFDATAVAWVSSGDGVSDWIKQEA